MSERLLFIRRLLILIEEEKSKPPMISINEIDRIADSMRNIGRMEIISKVLDFIHREQELERGNDTTI